MARQYTTVKPQKSYFEIYLIDSFAPDAINKFWQYLNYAMLK